VLGTVIKLLRKKKEGSPLGNHRPDLPPLKREGKTWQNRSKTSLPNRPAVREKQEIEALNALKLAPVTKKTEVLTKHIAEHAKKDATVMAQVMRSWMNEAKT